MPTRERTADAPLMLSVSGARGIVGKTMTPEVAARFAAAFGTHLRAERHVEHPIVCLGRDSRPSGAMLAAAAGAGLTAVGARVVDLGLVATPTVGIAMRHHEADGGMVVTASHNPAPWNGLKCLGPGGIAPPAPTADEIIRRFRDGDIAYVDALHALEHDDRGHALHVEAVLRAIDAAPIRAAGFRVVLDPVNGAGGIAGRMLLEALRVDVEYLNAEPSGRFAHAPEPLAENLVELAERTRAARANCGFAQDPDADRLAVIDERGRYIGEEYTLVLSARQCLRAAGPGRVLAANLSTSRMIDDVAARWAGASVVRTAVGEGNVAAALQAAGDAALLGGEGNGGVIYPAVGWTRDSLSAMALILALMAAEGKPLSAIADEFPAYAMIKRKLDLADLGGHAAVARALAAVIERYAGERIDDRDGVRVDLDEGWVHVRPSNTEPIVRIIAEASTEDAAGALADQVEATIRGAA